MKKLLPVLLVVGTTALALSQNHPPAVGHQPDAVAARPEPGSQALDVHLQSGNDAERRGDLAGAESHYREVVRMMPDSPLGYSELARLYDRAGRERDAYLAYRKALSGDYLFVSSMRQDPRPLAHFGDLAARYGTAQEAYEAYALAVGACNQDDVWEPRATPRNASFASLKAAAHTAAAVARGAGALRGKAMRELDLAVQTDPGYWVARYYRAIAYDRKRPSDAARDAALAERWAPPAGRRMVRWMRMANDIPDAAGRYLQCPAVPKTGQYSAPPDIPDSPVAQKPAGQP